ncbi:MAG: nucleotidyltransferase domain-containing protein [archaeon]
MINIYKLKLTILQQEIMRLLFIRVGTSLNARRIANLLEVSQPAVAKALPLMEKQGLIKLFQDKESRRWSIELNRDSKHVLGLKRADNLKQLYESGLIEGLWDNFAGSTVILFGSYALGEDTVKSDIDIAVIGSEKKDIPAIFDKILERNININYYKSFKSIDPLLLSNMLNGIVLKGSVDI